MKSRITYTSKKVNNVDLSSLTPLDSALEAMHFAFRGLIREADIYLESQGLTRVHHRILYVLARRERTTVGDLIDILGVSKQALHRPMTRLIDKGLVDSARDEVQARYKLLSLTKAGRELETEASNRERAAMGAAFEGMDDAEVQAWYDIMGELARRAR